MCLDIYRIEKSRTKDVSDYNIREDRYPPGNNKADRFNQNISNRLVGSHYFIFMDLFLSTMTIGIVQIKLAWA